MSDKDLIHQHPTPYPYHSVYNDEMIKEACSGDQPMIAPFIPYLVSKEKTTVPNDHGGVSVEEKGVVSYGLSSFGYDLRIGYEYMVLKAEHSSAKVAVRIGFMIMTVIMMVVASKEFIVHEDIMNGYSFFALFFLLLSIVVCTVDDEEPIDPKNFSKDQFKTIKVMRGEKIIVPPHSTILAHSLERFIIPEDTTGICVGKSTFARCGLSCLNTPVEAGWEGYLTLEFSNGTNKPILMYPGEGALQLVLFRGPKAAVSYRDRKGKYMNQPNKIVTPTV